MTDDQHHQLIAILVGIGLALAGAMLLFIITQPEAWTEAITTPCNIPECY